MLVELKTKGTLLSLIVLVLYSLLKIIHMNCLILTVILFYPLFKELFRILKFFLESLPASVQSMLTTCCSWVCGCSVASVVTLYDPMDCSLPGSPVHRIFQARILEWVAVQPKGWDPHLLHCRGILYSLSHLGSPCCSYTNTFVNVHHV